MKKLMIMLTLFIGVNAFAQNQGNGKSKIEKSNQSDKVKGFEKENVFKEEAMEIKEQKKKVDVNVVKENNGKADAVKDKEVLKGWEKDKSEKVKDDHDDEMHDEDKEHADLDKEKKEKEKKEKEKEKNKDKESVKEKVNEGNAYGKNKEGLSKEEFATLRSKKNKDRKAKKVKKEKKVK